MGIDPLSAWPLMLFSVCLVVKLRCLGAYVQSFKSSVSVQYLLRFEVMFHRINNGFITEFEPNSNIYVVLN